jgi:hypothetical protein
MIRQEFGNKRFVRNHNKRLLYLDKRRVVSYSKSLDAITHQGDKIIRQVVLSKGTFHA